MTRPTISVLLPVFNGSRYLAQSITSILAQRFTDFECIIVNDGSSDDSEAIIRSFDDERIILINQTNAGLPVSLNRAIRAARGRYLARQDADDISLPERFLDAHPHCVLLGTQAQIIEGEHLSARLLAHPTLNGELQLKLLFYNCFVHSSVMLRASALEKTGLYSKNPAHFPPEDYELWLRLKNVGTLANLPKPLLQYREVPSSISRTQLVLMQGRAQAMSLDAIRALLEVRAPQPLLAELLIAVMSSQVLAEPISTAQNKTLKQLLVTITQRLLERLPQDQDAQDQGAQGQGTQDEVHLLQARRDCEQLLQRAQQRAGLLALLKLLPVDVVPFLKKIKRALKGDSH